MKNRIFSLLLAIYMVFIMLPATVFATEEQMAETGSETLPAEPIEGAETIIVDVLSVGGVDALTQNTGDGWYYDSATDTLHLTGAYYDGDAEAAIYAEGDLTIDVAAGTENTFHGVNNGILVLGNLTITGSGMLTATASAAYGNGGDYGPVSIYVSENLRITGAKVAANADMVGIGSIGTMEIVDSAVEALGARNGLYSFDNLRISGSNVEAHSTSVQADNKWDFRGYFLMGICAQEGDLLIEDGSSVNVSADQFGLYAENTTIQDSDLCATATRAAICTAQKLTINGESNVELHATLTEEQHEEYGDQATALFGVEIEIDENLTIVGGVIGDSLVQGGAKSIVDSEGKDVVKASIISSVASGTCGDNLTWTLNSNGVLTIFGEGAMYDYSNGIAPWVAYQDQICSVVIKEGVTSIGAYAFADCENLTAVTLPAGLKNIGTYAFAMAGLTEITIPKSVEAIGEHALDCPEMTAIYAPFTETESGYYYAIDGILHANGALVRVPMAYPETELLLDSATIEDYALYGCENITTLVISSRVMNVHETAFADLPQVTMVRFQGDPFTIPANLFSGMECTVQYPCANTRWTEDVKQQYGGTLAWEPYGTNLVAEGICGEGVAVGIYGYPDDNITWTLTDDGTLTMSGTGATTFGGFGGNHPWCNISINDATRIRKVVVEEGITKMGALLFLACDYITEVMLPSTLTGFDRGTFIMLPRLEKVNIPEGVIVLPDYLFNGCSSLKEVEIPASVTTIMEHAFEGCTALNTIRFYGDAPSIHDTAFTGVTVMVYYPANNPTWTSDVMQQYGGTITWVTCYEILEGDNSVVDLGEASQLRIRADGEISKFVGVYVDGELVDASNYTVTEGSTIVTFTPEYLKTLEEGDHTIEIQFTDGVALADISVDKPVYILGDVNSDGVVNAHDRVYLARYLAKWTDYPASVINMDAADVNGDGAVNAHDRVYLARHLAKWTGYETLGA